MNSHDEKYYIGIDVSKMILDVYVLPCKKYMRFNNDDKGILKLVLKLKSFPQASIVMEATGGYEKPLFHKLIETDQCVSVVNPRFIRNFARSLGKLAKTDRLDSEIIALFAEKIQPQHTVMNNEEQQFLAALNARRRQLIDMMNMEKNRLDKTSNELKKSIQNIIKVLQKELDAINEALEMTIQNNPQLAQKNSLLKSIKGVGPVVAAGLIAELPELGSLTHKKISALSGLAPYNRDSGTSRGIRTIWGGRASVRSILYMATLVATRCNPQIKSFYDRLCRAGKKKKTALIACMHKLLIIMNAMIKYKQPWRQQLALQS